MAKRHHSSMQGYYEGHDERRAQEHKDGDMLNSDFSAIANMPQGVKMHEYPKERGYLPEDLNDDISGVDRQMGEDNSKKMRHFKPKKV